MARRRRKVRSARKGSAKSKVKAPVAFFAWAHSGKEPLDLSKEKLTVKLLQPFKNAGETKTSFHIEVWEKKMKREKNPSKLVFRLGFEASEEGGSWKVKAGALEQDAKAFPKRKASGGQELWLPAKLAVVDKDAKPVEGAKEIEFVLPPLELDGVLELQLGSSLGKTNCGVVRATWSTFASMIGMTPSDKSGGVTVDGKKSKAVGNGGAQRCGSLETVVLHCMSDANREPPSKFFQVDRCVSIFGPSLSAHFVIGRAGELVQCVDVSKHAWHAGGKHNRCSVGIELVGLHDQVRDKWEDKAAGYQKRLDDRAKIEAKLKSHRAAKGEGKKTVTVRGKPMDVDEAIAACEKGIAKADKQIEAFGHKKAPMWTRFDRAAFDEWVDFVSDKDEAGVPFGYLYTDAQMETLKKLLAALGKRYGYQRVRSHHHIRPTGKKKKTDPGKYFDWSKIEPVLLPGKLDGDESKGGGDYSVG